MNEVQNMATIAALTAEELIRIQQNRNTIRAKLVELNLAISTDTLDKLAAAIDGIINRGAVNASVREGETYTVEPGYYFGGTVAGVSGGGNYTLQEKTVTPTKNAQTVTSDSGYYGLSSVIVNAIPANFQDVSDVTATAPDVLLGKVIVTADGKVVAGTMPNNGTVTKTLDTSAAVYTFTAGYYAGGTISITLEEKTVTPTKSQQTITPTTGKVLSKVIINAIPDVYQDVSGVTAAAADVLTGKIIVDAEGNTVEGAMPNNGTLELTIDPLTQSSVETPAGYTSGGTVTVTDDLLNALKAI